MFNPIDFLINQSFDGNYRFASYVLVEVKNNKEDVATRKFLIKTRIGEISRVTTTETVENLGEAILEERYMIVRKEDINLFSGGGGEFIYLLSNANDKNLTVDNAIKINTIGTVYRTNKMILIHGLDNSIEYALMPIEEV